MNRSQQLVVLLEEISGNAAIVYHRTGKKAFIDLERNKVIRGEEIPERIITQGFVEGKNGLYGPGIYATYKLNSQFNTYMDVYGEYLVKCRVNLQGYLILDYAEARKVYRERYALRDQLSQYYSPQWLKRESEWIEADDAQLRQHPHDMTSKIAYSIYSLYNIDKIVPGMLFTGGHDDAVIITYRPEYILPIEYAHAPISTGTPVKWTALDTSGYVGHLRKVGTLIRTPAFTGSSHVLGFSDIFQKIHGQIGLESKEIINRLSKITSLSAEAEGIQYKPTFAKLPAALVTVIQQKFQEPEGEFYTLITPVLDKRFRELAKNICRYLQKIFPGVSIQCQPTETQTIRFTFTFHTSKAVLLFIKYTTSNEYYRMHKLSQFLTSDTPLTRETLMKSLLEELKGKLSRLFSPPYDIDAFTRLVQNAPSTK